MAIAALQFTGCLQTMCDEIQERSIRKFNGLVRWLLQHVHLWPGLEGPIFMIRIWERLNWWESFQSCSQLSTWPHFPSFHQRPHDSGVTTKVAKEMICHLLRQGDRPDQKFTPWIASLASPDLMQPCHSCNMLGTGVCWRSNLMF